MTVQTLRALLLMLASVSLIGASLLGASLLGASQLGATLAPLRWVAPAVAFAKPPPKLAPSLYTRLTLETFRKDPSLSEVINLDAPDLDRLEAAIFFATNEARVREKLPALAHHPALTRAASIHAHRMVEGRFFAHDNPNDLDLRTPTDRARQVGIANPTLAENLASEFALQYVPGSPIYAVDPATFHFSLKPGGPAIPVHSYLSLADSVVRQWLYSAPHEENLMFEDIVETGVGVALSTDEGFPRFKIVQLFQWDEHVRALR
jgi:uncharacterized protein YkwD